VHLVGYSRKKVHTYLTFIGPCAVIYSYNKSQRVALFLNDKVRYMFRTGPLSIVRSLNTVYTATGICHASYINCLLKKSGPR